MGNGPCVPTDADAALPSHAQAGATDALWPQSASTPTGRHSPSPRDSTHFLTDSIRVLIGLVSIWCACAHACVSFCLDETLDTEELL